MLTSVAVSTIIISCMKEHMTVTDISEIRNHNQIEAVINYNGSIVIISEIIIGSMLLAPKTVVSLLVEIEGRGGDDIWR